MLATLEETHESYKRMAETLRGHCNKDAPPTSKITGLLDEIIRACQFIFADKLVQPAEEAPATVDSADANSEAQATTQTGAATQTVTTTVMATRDGAIVNRDDALRRLSDIAQYFRTYEPHTPMGPSIERLIKWGRMSVGELMMELIPDAQAQAIFAQLTGVALDGSDKNRPAIVPPPVATAPAAQPATTSATTPATEPGAAAAEPAADAPPAKVGW